MKALFPQPACAPAPAPAAPALHCSVQHWGAPSRLGPARSGAVRAQMGSATLFGLGFDRYRYIYIDIDIDRNDIYPCHYNPNYIQYIILYPCTYLPTSMHSTYTYVRVPRGDGPPLRATNLHG